MIVKFHARGRGSGAGPVDYLLGKAQPREGAYLLQGKPDEVRELIDASPYAKKYTSGVLSFAEPDLPAGQREKLMESFERILMPGLDKDQYSILWVEHQDKGRLELNFVIPNTELQSGRRLQPYFDRADRPRIDAWQTIINGRLGLRDPNAPENRRALVTPSTLPETKQAASQAITDGLLRLCEAGEVKTRQDVIQVLTGAGFDVVRTTSRSISVADPDGGRNIRLKGAIYEQSFEAGEGLRAEIERAGARYRADAEARVQRAREVCRHGTELKREENQRRYQRAYSGYEHGVTVAPAECVTYGRSDVADPDAGLVPAGRHLRERAVVAREPDRVEPERAGPAGRRAVEADGPDMGRNVPGRPERSLSGVTFGDESRCGMESREAAGGETGEGVRDDDRVRNAVAERIGAVTERLRAAARRVGERLRGIACDVRTYAAGQRDIERAGAALGEASANLERATQSFEPVVRGHELAVAAERQRLEQKQKELEKVRVYRGPTLG